MKLHGQFAAFCQAPTAPGGWAPLEATDGERLNWDDLKEALADCYHLSLRSPGTRAAEYRVARCIPGEDIAWVASIRAMGQ